MNGEMNDFLTTSDVLAIMRVCEETLKNWVRAKKFPPPDGRRGRRNIWRRDTIERALEKMPRRPASM